MKLGKITFEIIEKEDGSLDIKPTIKGKLTYELTYEVSIAIIVMLIRGLKIIDTLPGIIWATIKEYIGGKK